MDWLRGLKRRCIRGQAGPVSERPGVCGPRCDLGSLFCVCSGSCSLFPPIVAVWAPAAALVTFGESGNTGFYATTSAVSMLATDLRKKRNPWADRVKPTCRLQGPESASQTPDLVTLEVSFCSCHPRSSPVHSDMTSAPAHRAGKCVRG